MLIDLVAFDIILLLMSPWVVLLSVWTGVRGWGWPSSSSVLWAGMAVLELRKRAPNLASAADDMTCLIMLEMLRTAPLLGVWLVSSDRK